MTAPLIVEAVRSGVVESQHLVDVAVLGGDGALVASAGDPHRPAAFRSAAKPIQARVAAACGWTPASTEALAVASASHSGEPGHVAAVRALLAAAGVAEDALRCPEALPFRPEDTPADGGRRRILHNCSGKHAAMLAACAAAGWSIDGYRTPAHPLQQRIITEMRDLLELDPRLLVDGCGVPTVVAPLSALACAFASVPGTPQGRAMRAHPWLVAGTDRLDTDLMMASGLVAKSGAEGLTCVGGEGITVALKSRDGAARACGPATLLVLEQLRLLDAVALDRLAGHRHPPVLGGGNPVGELGAHGTLARA